MDYTVISDKLLTFNAEETKADILINITDDLLYEHDENFFLKLILRSDELPGLNLPDNVTITIIDDDSMRTNKYVAILVLSTCL